MGNRGGYGGFPNAEEEAHPLSASWLSSCSAATAWKALEGLGPRPKTSPTRIADHYEDEVVALHKESIVQAG